MIARGSVIALALLPLLAIAGDAEDLRPLTVQEAAEVERLLRVESFRKHLVPFAAVLVLLNPTSRELRAAVLEDSSSDSGGGRSLSNGAPSTLRIETWEDGIWVDRTVDESVSPLVLPAGFARTFMVRCPPSVHSFRVGVQLAEDPARWIYTPRTDRPHNLVKAPVGGRTVPYLAFDGFDDLFGRESARVLAVNPPGTTPAEFWGDDFGHPAVREMRVLEDGAWISKRMTGCAACTRAHEIPSGMAMPFLVPLRDERRPMRIGLKLGGELRWTDRIEPPPRFKPLGKEVEVGPLTVTLAEIEESASLGPFAWYWIENRTTETVKIRSRRGKPVRRVEILVEGTWANRNAHYADVNDGIEPRVPDMGDGDLELPPRTALAVSAQFFYSWDTLRIGVVLSDPLAKPRVVWGDSVADPRED